MSRARHRARTPKPLGAPKAAGPNLRARSGRGARARPQPRRQPAGARARSAARGRRRAIARGPLSRLELPERLGPVFEPVGFYGVPIVF